MYRRSFTGTETELFTTSETAGYTSCYDEYQAPSLVSVSYAANKIVLAASERIVVKLYGRTTNLTATNVGLYYDGSYNWTHTNSDVNHYGYFSCIDTPITRGFDTPGHRDRDKVLNGAGEWMWIEPYVAP